MDTTQQQLQTALRKALKAEGLATKTDISDLKETVKQGEAEILQAINTAFQEHETTVLSRFDRIEKIVDSWPAPSTITNLLERVSVIERRLKIEPTVG